MGENTLDRYGAKGRRDAILLDPERIELITDPNHPLYVTDVHLPVNEGLVGEIRAGF